VISNIRNMFLFLVVTCAGEEDDVAKSSKGRAPSKKLPEANSSGGKRVTRGQMPKKGMLFSMLPTHVLKSIISPVVKVMKD
jgi:hypothetical protein